MESNQRKLSTRWTRKYSMETMETIRRYPGDPGSTKSLLLHFAKPHLGEVGVELLDTIDTLDNKTLLDLACNAYFEAILVKSLVIAKNF